MNSSGWFAGLVTVGLLMLPVGVQVGASELVSGTEKGSEIKATKSARLVDGMLLKIDGEYYIVMDKAGKEVRVQVDRETKKMGGIKRSGDMIKAEITKNGRAIAIQ